MKMLREKAQRSYVTTVGKRLKTGCQVRKINIADWSLYNNANISEIPDPMCQKCSMHERIEDL